MSHGKYAHITAELLARKGEARPWPALTRAEEMPEYRPWRPAPAPPPPPPPEIKERNCAFRMSAHDYERLGILAVKSGSSRQQLLKDALAQFLAGKAREHGCACLGACTSDCAPGG
jgi:hypothetical protein